MRRHHVLHLERGQVGVVTAHPHLEVELGHHTGEASATIHNQNRPDAAVFIW